MTEKRRGRPRSFDREAALRKAVDAFWEHGYEPTSVSDLTEAMGIGAPSLYAAFGDKKTLFLEAVEVYLHDWGGFTRRALAEEPTARRAVRRVLREAAENYTLPGRPPGCMVTNAAVNCGDTSREVAERLRGLRLGNMAAIRDRIRADAAAGLLPAGADPAALAAFVAAVMQGMSQQARDGAGRAELEAVAEAAMAAWPGTGETADHGTADAAAD
ncbi:TetR/AcrR family transcriptional regulator [Streptomyces aidingensis]|uniref:DNA-binding transcriptional regulator, AcrR family n=1 Tax=Streptomyces aidingensis TaxID=910347 RepID=A0A1I1RLQ0_9ACTN|nr:TetR/AcrR family transcriptional regulator [Streptomyces aidingensis]SFD35204.1 DNA-binding transcriptional regulator, AcrR family [Streptomyces aidingensis]